MSTTVGTKGQVTIERDIREALGVQPGWRAIQRRVGNQVVISFRPPKHRRSLLGILGDPQGPHLQTSEEFQAAVERAWDEAAVEVLDQASRVGSSASRSGRL
jgi:bifunctional DNA-binding transcriptional regulator/antitoxin component of YhaV-PrlF toxin-antitoxin module